jgi:5-formyltetrahydrofolate cyclo-ligase
VKKELRTRIRSVLAALPPESIQERSRLAAARLFAEPDYQRAEIMMIYLSHAQEADTTPIVLQAWQDRKKVVAPQVSWESRQMIPIEIRNLDDDVAANNQLGIREPVHGLPLPIELIDLVIVPGLGFDPFGNRLGRGRGFYDRFLGKPEFRGVSCGFALEEQVVPSIPAGPLDQRVHMLVTDQAVRRFDP